MTSALLRCRQSRLRPRWRAAAAAAGRDRRRSHCVDVVVVELLAPEQAGERLALHQPLVVGQRRPAAARRRRRRPRPAAAAKSASKSAKGSAAAGVASRRQAQPQTVVAVAPGVDGARGSAPRPWCPSPSGLTAPRRPSTTALVEAVLDVRRAGSATPHSRSTLVSFSVKSSSGVALAGQPVVAQVVVLGVHERLGRARCAAADGAARARRASRPQAQVLRNQSVGSRCSVGRLRPAVGGADADQDVVRARPWRTRRRRRSSGPRRRRRCRSARTPARPCRAAGSRRPGRRRGRRACGYL